MSRVAVVSGAARGIGAATVGALVRDGWSVVAVDACADDGSIDYPLASRSDLDSLAALGNVTTLVADVRDAAALADAVDAALSSYGGLDAAIAAAGVIAGGAPHWETDPAAEQVVIDVDLIGVMNLARVAVPAMMQRPQPRHGRFLAVASSAATQGLPRLAAYCAAKAGVAGFIRGLAADLRGTGITANAVAPGSTETAMLEATANIYDLASVDVFAQQQPIERLIEPEEIATALAWLAGADTDAVTGAMLAVDGGLSL
ncbi:MAG TPA: mycofactocin-coupled SDR family oxidoreductase [Mycobacteriales bacterium]|nr:mycofactocin-coupled SDR family oxidoreductase [Mycobacteriales bacterium]